MSGDVEGDRYELRGDDASKRRGCRLDDDALDRELDRSSPSSGRERERKDARATSSFIELRRVLLSPGR